MRKRELARRPPEPEKHQSSNEHKQKRKHLEYGEHELRARAGLGTPGLQGADRNERGNGRELDGQLGHGAGGFIRVGGEGGVVD